MPSLSGVVAVLALSGQSLASVARPRHEPIHKFIHPTHPSSKRDNLVPLLGARVDTNPGPGPITLLPIRPNAQAKKAKRDAAAADGGAGNPFDLIDQDALYWAGSDGTVAELLIDMPGDNEAIVDMEYFDDLVESVTCPEGGSDVTIDFQDQTNLDAAGAIWAWVNESEENAFFLMVGAGDCGWNEDRFLFRVDSIRDITADTKVATLVGGATTWHESLHSYDLSIGNLAMGGQSGTVSEESLVKRGIFDSIGDALSGEFNPDLSVPLDTSLTGQSLTFTLQDGITLTGKCVDCTTTGTIDAEAKFRVKFFDLEEAFVELRTTGLSATAVIALTMSGDLTDSILQQSLPLFKASPAGVAIPGIVTIGPTVGVALTAGIGAIKGAVTVTAGGTASIPASRWKLDFLSEAGSVAEGWVPTLETVPLEAEASVAVSATASLDASVGLELSVLGELSACYV